MATTEQRPKAPTIEELRRAYQEGVLQTLLSGIEVQMRPVTPDRLLAAGHIPNTLTPIMLKGLYEDIHGDLDEFAQQKHDDQASILAWIEAVNAVCEAALVEPDVVPYLSLADRLWIFKLAFMPVEVLSRFRLQPRRDVDTASDGEGDGDTTERTTVRERRTRRVSA